jgi:hypothetical protein
MAESDDAARRAGDRAFEARRTQPGSRGGRPVFAPTKGTRYVGRSLTPQGNERALGRREKGRLFKGEKGAERPHGTSNARFVNGVNPKDSITGTYLPRP